MQARRRAFSQDEESFLADSFRLLIYDGIVIAPKMVNELSRLLRKLSINDMEIPTATWTHHVVFGRPDDESDMKLQVVDPQLDTDDREDEGDSHKEEEDSISPVLNELEAVTYDDELEFEERVDEAFFKKTERKGSTERVFQWRVSKQPTDGELFEWVRTFLSQTLCHTASRGNG
jgi:hypothetical protein